MKTVKLSPEALASYSDVGLKKCGLTRAQYEAAKK